MPAIAGISVSTMFLGLFVLSAIYTVWLHFTARNRGEGVIARALTAAPIPVAAGFMVLVFVASMAVGVVRQYPTYSNGWANLRALAGGCGLADDVLVEPGPNNGFLTPQPGDYGPLGPLGGSKPVGFSADGLPEKIVAEAIRVNNPMPGVDHDWEGRSPFPGPASTDRPCRCPTNSIPPGCRWPAATPTQRSRKAC